MQSESFSSLVKQYFGYLIDEYNFQIKREYDSFNFNNSSVEFHSPMTIVVVTLERGATFVLIGPSSEPEIARLSLESIIDFLSQGRDTDLIDTKDTIGNIRLQTEYCLSRYATLLQNYGDSVLRGDFSWWVDACKYTLAKIHDTYRSLTSEEPPKDDPLAEYIKIKEANNNWKIN